MNSLPAKAAALVAVFLLVTAIASLAGAANLGTAATFGQVAFAIVLVAMLLLRPRGSAAVERRSGPAGKPTAGD